MKVGNTVIYGILTPQKCLLTPINVTIFMFYI